MLKNSTSEHPVVSAIEAKSQRDRKRDLGIYYTPPNAAEALARWAIRSPSETVLEPSFGGCAMLAAAVNVFHSLGNAAPSEQLYGYDVDDAAFTHLAQMGIDNENRHFRKQNFLQSVPADLRVDAVLANPPFVSYHRLSKEQRLLANQVQKQYLPNLPKLASLWVHFVLHSTSFLRVGGRMAFVLPTAIGTADYARPLLVFLQNCFSKVELIHVSERLFLQAGTDERISLLLLDGYTPLGLHAPTPLDSKYAKNIHAIEFNNLIATSSCIPIKDMRDIAETALHALHETSLKLLGSVASVRIGEVVGDIKFFVKSAPEWKKLKVGVRHIQPLLTRSSQVKGVYVGSEVTQSTPSTIPFLLVPPVKRIPQDIQAHLSKYSREMIDSNQTFNKRPIWYRCKYQTNATAFIGSISHDYPRIVGNNTDISCSNAFYKIITDDAEVRRWLPILSLTTPLRLSAEILGRVRGSGGIKLEPSDVKKLYIPSAFPKMGKSKFKLLQDKISQMLLSGNLECASQLADSEIFLIPKLIDAITMEKFKKMRAALTNRRLNKHL